jgi:hypothetical protein
MIGFDETGLAADLDTEGAVDIASRKRRGANLSRRQSRLPCQLSSQ